MSDSVRSPERRRGKKHSAFEANSDIKECWGRSFLLQKLNYIHDNPLQDRWRLAEKAADYFHSSARWYEKGEHAGYAVTDYREFF